MARKARKMSKLGMYHVILRGHAGDNIFAGSAKDKFKEFLQYYKPVCGYQLYGYCILENHLHLLLKEAAVGISTIMRHLILKYVKWYNQEHNRGGKLFYDRFKCEPIESTEQLVKTLRFIQQEPVRNGLVIDSGSYEYSSQHEYTGTAALVDTAEVLEYFGASPVRFGKFMNEPAPDDGMDVRAERMSDDELREHLRLALVTAGDELLRLSKASRDAVLHKLKALPNVSVGQLARVSGCSESIVYRA